MKHEKFTPEIGELIAAGIAKDYTYDQIAADIGVPSETMWYWVRHAPALLEHCAPARPAQAERIENKIIELQAKLEQGTIAPDIARVLLAAMQWRAGKKNPRLYGDKTILSNDPENPITSLALRLDTAIGTQNKLIDVTPVKIDTGEDLV